MGVTALNAWGVVTLGMSGKRRDSTAETLEGIYSDEEVKKNA
ncbi:hypothetical protein [Litchfieldella qijiaojingensis]|nr:hypothetical protein [Halomonas qijiaojingensis]